MALAQRLQIASFQKRLGLRLGGLLVVTADGVVVDKFGFLPLSPRLRAGEIQQDRIRVERDNLLARLAIQHGDGDGCSPAERPLSDALPVGIKLRQILVHIIPVLIQPHIAVLRRVALGVEYGKGHLARVRIVFHIVKDIHAVAAVIRFRRADETVRENGRTQHVCGEILKPCMVQHGFRLARAQKTPLPIDEYLDKGMVAAFRPVYGDKPRRDADAPQRVDHKVGFLAATSQAAVVHAHGRSNLLIRIFKCDPACAPQVDRQRRLFQSFAFQYAGANNLVVEKGAMLHDRLKVHAIRGYIRQKDIKVQFCRPWHLLAQPHGMGGIGAQQVKIKLAKIGHGHTGEVVFHHRFFLFAGTGIQRRFPLLHANARIGQQALVFLLQKHLPRFRFFRPRHRAKAGKPHHYKHQKGKYPSEHISLPPFPNPAGGRSSFPPRPAAKSIALLGRCHPSAAAR